MKKLKLLLITGSRGEWGYIRPLLRLCRDRSDVECDICATNMHLLPGFGLSVKEIERDGFQIQYRIHMALDGYNHFTMAKSLGIFLTSFCDILGSSKPNWILLAGDRGEQLMAAIAGAHCYIPVAHIQAGERSGNIDGMTRHAIGKYAHFHFAANKDAAERLLRLGEEAFRVHCVGAPQLDELEPDKLPTRSDVTAALSLPLDTPFLLVVLHPVTEEYGHTAEQVAKTMLALNEIPHRKIVILPNNDAGSLLVKEGIERYRRGEYHVFANLKREYYLALLRDCLCIVGNSSSGLLEAPTFKIPAVNIGRRQAGRVRGPNVIDSTFENNEIVQAIQKAASEDFRSSLRSNCENPYGDGKASARILETLLRTQVTDRLLTKELTY